MERKPTKCRRETPGPASLLSDSVQFVLLQRVDKTFVATQYDQEKPRDIKAEIRGKVVLGRKFLDIR